VKSIGEEVRITYSTREMVEAGDVIVTTTGRGYLVAVARRMRTNRPIPCWALRCVVIGKDLPNVARVHSLVWNSRSRRPRPR
jgi:hypothetical protein